nr:hypothetical protein [Tanacetum cinerariifolium]
ELDTKEEILRFNRRHLTINRPEFVIKYGKRRAQEHAPYTMGMENDGTMKSRGNIKDEELEDAMGKKELCLQYVGFAY